MLLLGTLVLIFNSSDALAWIQNQVQQSCPATASAGSSKRSIAGCAIPDAMAAMNALDGPLSNLLTIGKLPPLAAGDLYNAFQAIFATGRAIAALAMVSVSSLPWVHMSSKG